MVMYFWLFAAPVALLTEPMFYLTY